MTNSERKKDELLSYDPSGDLKLKPIEKLFKKEIIKHNHYYKRETEIFGELDLKQILKDQNVKFSLKKDRLSKTTPRAVFNIGYEIGNKKFSAHMDIDMTIFDEWFANDKSLYRTIERHFEEKINDIQDVINISVSDWLDREMEDLQNMMHPDESQEDYSEHEDW